VFSEKLANVHFWLVLVGQLIFSVTMWITGIQQGAMWKAMESGKLRYTFVEGLARNYPYYHLRAVGGLVFLAGMVLFVYNVLKTIQKGRALDVAAPAEPRPVIAAQA
jgi:cytochrome c oxidase cbb3-type subunit 1